MRAFKKHIKLIVPMKEEELKYYKQFADFLNKYEETNEKHVGNTDKPVKLISGDSQSALKNKLDAMS